MKKILSLAACALFAISLFAQETPDTIKTVKKKPTYDLANRANDHILVQFGYTKWANQPDTINTSGFSKSINAYFMFDFPFKTNPHMSVAFGPGISTDHILFTKTNVGIKDKTPTLYFTNVADTNHFKKTKLATAYLEAPVELRFSADPMTGKGLKAAIGVKVGLLVNAHTRNTKYEDKNGTLLNDYVMKEASKVQFNKNRISAMARLGYGHFTLYASYQLTPLFKSEAAPQVKPFSIGLTLSGL